MTVGWPVNGSTGATAHPRGWNWVPITDVAELVTGHTPARDRSEYWDGGISWINLNEIRHLNGQVCDRTDLQISAEGVANSSAVIHPAGTVCMSRTASVGFVTQMGRPMTTSQDFVNWICGPDLDPGYLMKALIASRPQILALCSGSTHKTMYVRDAERLRVLLPPIEQQRRIAAVLDTADALRAKRRQALAKLETLTQAIFIDMFGDPAQNPNGLPEVRLEEVAGQVTDGEHQTPPRSDGGVKLLSARNVRNGSLDLSNVDYVTEETYDKLSRRCDPTRGDVLISCSGTIGRVARLDGAEPFALVRSVALVRPTKGRIESRFLEAQLRTETLNRLMNRRANASSQANLFQNQIRALPVLLPPMDHQKEFSRRAKAVERSREPFRDGIEHSDTLFASLQQRAFRGDL